ncbi:MAG: WD40/YVTN/BNR-like repeat-containing protein [Thermoplasmatota archaeon]
MQRGDTVVLAGTRKGLFMLSSKDRAHWTLSGPEFSGTTVHHAAIDARNGTTFYAAITSGHWGGTVGRSKDRGATWTKPAEGPKFPQGSDLAITRIWHVEPGHKPGEVYAGAEPAGLFFSADSGETWTSVDGLNLRKDRSTWQPGGGGLCLHTILPYPGDPKRMIVAISSVGIMGTSDGGATWRIMNNGIRNVFNETKVSSEEESTCPHKLVRDPKDPAILYMQNHWGQFMRKRGDSTWTDIGQGLPSTFGFPMAAHPRKTGTVYAVPMEGDFNRVTLGGAMAVYRRDGAKGWTRLSQGLPQKDAYLTILREGLATDDHDPAGVYVGTEQGQIFASRDEGESWQTIAQNLPPIVSVTAARMP